MTPDLPSCAELHSACQTYLLMTPNVLASGRLGVCSEDTFTEERLRDAASLFNQQRLCDEVPRVRVAGLALAYLADLVLLAATAQAATSWKKLSQRRARKQVAGIPGAAAAMFPSYQWLGSRRMMQVTAQITYDSAPFDTARFVCLLAAPWYQEMALKCAVACLEEEATLWLPEYVHWRTVETEGGLYV